MRIAYNYCWKNYAKYVDFINHHNNKWINELMPVSFYIDLLWFFLSFPFRHVAGSVGVVVVFNLCSATHFIHSLIYCLLFICFIFFYFLLFELIECDFNWSGCKRCWLMQHSACTMLGTVRIPPAGKGEWGDRTLDSDAFVPLYSAKWLDGRSHPLITLQRPSKSPNHPCNLELTDWNGKCLECVEQWKPILKLENGDFVSRICQTSSDSRQTWRVEFSQGPRLRNASKWSVDLWEPNESILWESMGPLPMWLSFCINAKVKSGAEILVVNFMEKKNSS